MFKSISDTVLFLDTETGGVSDEYSLLSVALIKVDEDLNPIDELEILIKHTHYVINSAAVKINKFDVLKHEDTSLLQPFQELTSLHGAKNSLTDFIQKNFAGIKPSMAAWNSPFDYRFIRNHLFDASDAKYSEVLGYRQHDLSSIISAMCHAGIFTFQNKGMQHVCKELDIDPGNAHTAIDDVRTMIKLYKIILTILGKVKYGKD